MQVKQRLLTVDDLAVLPDNDKRYELHNGVLVEVAGSKYAQTILAAWLIHLLFNFIQQSGIGVKVSGADGAYVLDRYNTRLPDVGYMSPDSVARQRLDEYMIGAPDLAVEVVSPSNTPDDLRQRVGAYLRAGSRLVWLIYPDSKAADVYRPDADTLTYSINDTLDGGDVLPGFSVKVSEIFAVLD